MTTTIVTAAGESLNIVVTPEMKARLSLNPGDRICVIETPGGIELQPLSAEAAAQLEVGRQVMKDSEEALRELAK